MKVLEGDGGSRSRWRMVFDLSEQLMCLVAGADGDDQLGENLYSSQRDLIITAVERLIEARASLWLKPDKRLSASMQSLKDIEPEDGLMRQAYEARRAVARGLEGKVTTFNQSTGIASKNSMALAIPLIVQDHESPDKGILGVLKVEREAGQPFSREDLELLEGLAVQILISLQASQQMRSERWRLQQLSLVGQVSNQIADVRDLDELARRVARLILETFDYYYVAIFTLEPGCETLHFHASAGPLGDDANKRGQHSPALLVNLGEGIIGSVAKSGLEILAADVRHETRYEHLDILPETRSEVALPLKIENQVLGVLDVQSDQVDDFDETDMLVLTALADNIAYAVEGARLYSDLHLRAEQLSSLQEVNRAVTSILDQRELLDEVVNLIQQRFGYHNVHLFTVHPGRRKIFYEAGSGEGSQELREASYSLNLDDPKGIIPWVARYGETMLVNDVTQEALYRPSPLPPDDTCAELCVPLKFGGEVLGVLDIQSDEKSVFSQDDRFLCETLADNIAVALRNATLYRSESWRRQVADSLREVAGLLSAETDLEHVLNTILVELERSLPLSVAAIWLMDEETLQDESQDEATIYLAAVRGQEVVDLELELGLRPEDVIAFNPPPGQILDTNNAGKWLLEALMASKPLIRSPKALFEPLGACLDYPGDYSTIGAPLRAGARPLGVLVLADPKPGRYGSEARAMTAAFASYASVAIENTRLYEAAYEQAWVSTVLLQVADATQAQTNLEELLDTVISITPTLSGVKACLLYLVDEAGGFSPAAATGLDEDQLENFECLRFSPGDVPVLSRLLEDGYPQLLYGNEDDQPLVDLLYGDGITQAMPLLVLVPLMAHDEVLGAFLVDYSAEGSLVLGSSLDLLFDERLAIIQGIAHQTAMAVENIQLLKAQKEEAYISVALLQVAQAVVSAADLDEILGSIVRITPILVGVQRSAIYLWNDEQETFQPTQTYGIKKQLQAESYTQTEFPFLDAVIQRDQIVAYPMSALKQEGEEQSQPWSRAEVLTPTEVDVFLETDTPLLLAFPLSVKGEVYGVFLVEEPHDDEPTPAAGTYLRLREKRLEIITGISQQVALAIQNDYLQREIFERERLAREMQLARDIQRAFIPEVLPDVSGWDLQAHWRTAREVGGDFYDVFELPDGRLGIVIADVADKGMPAALFMTLVRTLVRATIGTCDSPHEALVRVNEIIEPDAPQGMFVTLVYAILDPDDGTMDYANAGHNPPLILRGEMVTQRLERSGMALGVILDNPIESRQIVLELQDFLLFYTDGVTEAFSPAGEIYGIDRLCKVIEDAASSPISDVTPSQVSALDMVKIIDESVTEFVGDYPLADDLTMVVIKRLSVGE